VNTLLQLLSILFPVSTILLIVAGGLLLLARAHEEAESEWLSPRDFRRWAELSLRNYRQRKEREEAEGG